jgi:hypothetical protein
MILTISEKESLLLRLAKKVFKHESIVCNSAQAEEIILREKPNYVMVDLKGNGELLDMIKGKDKLVVNVFGG